MSSARRNPIFQQNLNLPVRQAIFFQEEGTPPHCNRNDNLVNKRFQNTHGILFNKYRSAEKIAY